VVVPATDAGNSALSDIEAAGKELLCLATTWLEFQPRPGG
jgi:hypothetical protein